MPKIKKSSSLPPSLSKSLNKIFNFLNKNVVVILFTLVILFLIYLIVKQTEGMANNELDEKSLKDMLQDIENKQNKNNEGEDEDEDEDKDEDEGEGENEGVVEEESQDDENKNKEGDKEEEEGKKLEGFSNKKKKEKKISNTPLASNLYLDPFKSNNFSKV